MLTVQQDAHLHLAALAHGHAALGRLVDEGLVDVGDNSSAGDGGLDEGVELLISANGELQVTRGDALDLEVLGSVAGELENLSGEVLKDGGRVDGGGSTDALVGSDAALEETVDTADRELCAGNEGKGDGKVRANQQRRLKEGKRAGDSPGARRGSSATAPPSLPWGPCHPCRPCRPCRPCQT